MSVKNDKNEVKKGRPVEKVIQPIKADFNRVMDAMIQKPKRQQPPPTR